MDTVWVQCMQWIAGTLKVMVCMVYSSFVLDLKLISIGGVKHFGDLVQNALAFRRVAALNGAEDTGIEMSIQDLCADFVERALDGLDLPDDVDAVFILFQHPLNSADVSFNGFESLN
jgi:hypothetical protein